MLGRPAVSRIKYLAPAMMGLSFLDSVLKEQAWVPLGAKQVAFFLLGPLVAAGMVLLIPYMKSRLAIVTPRRTSDIVLYAAAGVAGLSVLVWSIMYYQEQALGALAVRSPAWFLKDSILVSSTVVFGFLAHRLFRWYRTTQNKAVLAFAGFAVSTAFFSALHLFPDFIAKPSPPLLVDAIGATFLGLLWSSNLALILMYGAYYGRSWRKYPFVTTFQWASTTVLVLVSILGAHGLSVVLDPTLRTILVFGLASAGFAYFSGYFRLVPVSLNPTAKDYYRGVGYGMGLLAGSTCGIGLGLPITFPLSGLPSLSILLSGASLAFAAFTSSAAYFSISEDVRRQIRQSTDFVTSIGEAESTISTERKIQEFYDRFTGMARASGAVEEAAISKDEIYSYASALKKIQIIGVGKAP